jgi:WD40 repeat protein
MATAPCGDTQPIQLYNVHSGLLTNCGLKRDEPEAFNFCTFSPTGGTILSGSATGTLSFWNTISGRVKFTAKHPTPFEEVLRCGCFVTEHEIVTGSDEGSVEFWSVEAATAKLVYTKAQRFGENCGRVKGLVVSKDRRFAMSWGHIVKGHDAVKLTRTATGMTFANLSGGNGNITTSAMYSPDGLRICSLHAWRGSTGAYTASTMKVWDATSARLLRTIATGLLEVQTALALTSYATRVLSTCFSADSATIVVSGSHDGTLKFWDTSTGIIKHTLRCGLPIISCNSHPDDGSFWCVREDGVIQEWKL